MDGIPRTWCVVSQSPMPTATNNILAEGDTDGSSEEDASVEVISPPRYTSPPHRPITRSVSAKHAADEMEPEDVDILPTSPPPHPRKIPEACRDTEYVRCLSLTTLLTFHQDHLLRSRYSRVLLPLSQSGQTVYRESPLTSTRITLNRRILGRTPLHTFDPYTRNAASFDLISPISTIST